MRASGRSRHCRHEALRRARAELGQRPACTAVGCCWPCCLLAEAFAACAARPPAQLPELLPDAATSALRKVGFEVAAAGSSDEPAAVAALEAAAEAAGAPALTADTLPDWWEAESAAWSQLFDGSALDEHMEARGGCWVGCWGAPGLAAAVWLAAVEGAVAVASPEHLGTPTPCTTTAAVPAELGGLPGTAGGGAAGGDHGGGGAAGAERRCCGAARHVRRQPSARRVNVGLTLSLCSLTAAHRSCHSPLLPPHCATARGTRMQGRHPRMHAGGHIGVAAVGPRGTQQGQACMDWRVGQAGLTCRRRTCWGGACGWAGEGGVGALAVCRVARAGGRHRRRVGPGQRHARPSPPLHP